MGKLGNYQYPSITVSDAIKIADLVVKQFRGAISTSGLADALNMSERGGGFIHKMAALRSYGLVEGRGTLRTTPRAERIILPDSAKEAARTACETFLAIELFTELDIRLGDEVPDVERLGILLGEITGDRIQARRQARSIRRFYADYVPYLRDAHATDAWEVDDAPPASRPKPQIPAASNVDAAHIELRAGSIHLILPRTVASVRVLEQALAILRQDIEATEDDAPRVHDSLPTFLSEESDEVEGEVRSDQHDVPDHLKSSSESAAEVQ